MSLVEPNLVKYPSHMRDHSRDPSYKLHNVWLVVAPTPRLNYKKSFRRFVKQMILYRFTERNLYHLVLVVVGEKVVKVGKVKRNIP